MTTSNTAVTTIRINTRDANEIAQSSFILPSDLKDTWAWFYPLPEHVSDWCARGAYTDAAGRVHVSLTDVPVDVLNATGLVDPVGKTVSRCRAAVMSRVRIHHVGDHLWIISTGENNELHTFVTASTKDEIKAAILAARKLLEANSVLWAKWCKDATWIEHNGHSIAKMPNGLSVAFGLDGYCQTGYNGDYESHVTAYDFYDYLTKFF